MGFERWVFFFTSFLSGAPLSKLKMAIMAMGWDWGSDAAGFYE